MRCPVCEVELKMTERQGVEIDYCPTCRGVWLDRGELDKIIERSATLEAPRHTSHRPSERWDDADDRYRHKKRRGFLGDLFDFD